VFSFEAFERERERERKRFKKKGESQNSFRPPSDPSNLRFCESVCVPKMVLSLNPLSPFCDIDFQTHTIFRQRDVSRDGRNEDDDDKHAPCTRTLRLDISHRFPPRSSLCTKRPRLIFSRRFACEARRCCCSRLSRRARRKKKPSR
jgi:hypothetical protein